MKCKECNNKIDFCYYNDGELKERKLCFHCNFWYGYYLLRNDPNIARIKGEHYYIAKEELSSSRGFGGRKFIIKFFNGRKIITTNLWHQGDIPEHFKTRLLDNAEFVEE